MPVVTRSCTKQKGRPRIEDETPATTNANRCRYVTRSSAKRKILQQENEGKEEEPPSKRAASCRTSKNASRTTRARDPSFQELNNTKINQDNRGGHKNSSKCCTSRIPKRTAVKDNKTASSRSNKEHENKIDSIKSQIMEKNASPLNTAPDSSGTIPKTPAGCIAARIRSYSALRRSQWKKKKNQELSVSDKESAMPPSNTRSPLGEVSFNPRTMEGDTDSDEDILWKMSRRQSAREKENVQDSNSDDEISYKSKYFTLMTAMKQLQNSFLRAQQNAERNVKASEKFVNELKSSLGIEKQKNSLLNEELKIKKGTVERLRSDLENVKAQLEYVKEEKVNIEKHDREQSEKEKSLHDETPGKNEATRPQLIEDQKSVINFYSRLIGVSLSPDNTCEDSSSFQSFNCTFFPTASSTHSLQFRLTLDKEFDEIEYSPNPQSPGSEDVLLNLPKYLQENIFFGADQAPRFLAKLLKTAE